ncbi:MAG: hypothetical protein HLUCCO02_12745 [Idiomarinaceae bacterium HL-53]|nr:MAG: hypothetical protein HLUCCO02_12745 [Idiomarinaceae bacterium HL-53]CUS47486.1 hypothetical protein Ga0003345_0413 [Idiomarinaceae bacterium HL-53]
MDDEHVSLALQLVAKYRREGRFKSSIPISQSPMGAAKFIAYIAYPKATEAKRRTRFQNAMLSGAAREYGLQNGDLAKRAKLIELFGLENLLIWRDIDSAITGKGSKLGGGTKRLTDRFYAYHAYRMNDTTQAENKEITFSEILSHVATVYESKGMKLSDPDVRLGHLKRLFRHGRPVLHLVWGLIESHQSKGWCDELGQLSEGVKPAIGDWGWLESAHEIADLVLGLHLIEHESYLQNDKQLRLHKFDPSEVIDLYKE